MKLTVGSGARRLSAWRQPAVNRSDAKMEYANRFDFLYEPLLDLQERLKEELARNPFVDLAGPNPKDGEGAQRNDGDDPSDDVPPASGPGAQPQGPA